MLKRIVLGIVLLTLIFVVACSAASVTQSPESILPSTSPIPEQDIAPTTDTEPAPVPMPAPVPKPEGPIKAIWIEPTIKGETLYLDKGQIEKNWNTHFKAGDMNFMAYIYDGEIYVRANVCPPCRSVGFSLADDILVCDRCATTFESKTGAGIEGACVDFPKASVKYKIEGDKLVMTEADLSAAYDETLKPG